MKWCALLLLAGCTSTHSLPPLPPLPRFKAIGLIDPPSMGTPVYTPNFLYPSNACVVSWTLQGSSNLVDWVDVGSYAVNCPTNTQDVYLTNTLYFYRLKGQ